MARLELDQDRNAIAATSGMLPDFEKCVGAIADALVKQERQLGEQGGDPRQVASYLLATHAQMPDYLRIVFRVLTIAFDAWSYPRNGVPFHRLGIEGRLAQLERWDCSRLQSRRALVNFYRTFTVFGLYSELDERDHDSDQRREPH